MRNIIAVLAILLLAAAGAAGAGDGIKWKRAKGLTYITPGNEVPLAPDDRKEYLQKYELSWSAPYGEDIYKITAVYLAWDFRYYYLTDLLESGQLGFDEYAAELGKASDDFDQYLNFFVIVLADEERHARLSNRNYWEVYLKSGEEKTLPSKIEFYESPFKAAVLKALYEAGLGPLIIRSEKTYFITFSNPFRASCPSSIQLILLCEDCRRGFEWRFKE